MSSNNKIYHDYINTNNIKIASSFYMGFCNTSNQTTNQLLARGFEWWMDWWTDDRSISSMCHSFTHLFVTNWHPPMTGRKTGYGCCIQATTSFFYFNCYYDCNLFLGMRWLGGRVRCCIAWDVAMYRSKNNIHIKWEKFPVIVGVRAEVPWWLLANFPKHPKIFFQGSVCFTGYHFWNTHNFLQIKFLIEWKIS